MNRLLLVISILTAGLNSSLAQNGYEKIYGGALADWFLYVIPTSDGGTIACGDTRSYGFGDINNYDGYIVKMNHAGDTLWMRHFGTVNLEEATSIIENPAGYLILGYNFSLVNNSYDCYAVQFDVNGNQLWENYYGGVSTDWCFGATSGPHSNTVMCGITTSFTNGGSDAYAVKIDSNGNQITDAHYGAAGNENAGAVIQTLDGGYAFIGYSNSTDPNYNIYLVKTDSDLNFLWSKDFGGIYEDVGSDLVEDSLGNLWLLGYETGSPDSSYMVVIKTDANGENAVTFHPGTHAGDLGSSIRHAKGGGFLISGVTNVFGKGSEMLLEKLNSNGDTLWTRHFGGSQNEFSYCVASDDSGNIYVAGETEGFGTNQFDAYIIKTDSAGDIPCPQEVSFTSSANETCEDENIFFTNTTISSQNFSWDIDGNNFSNNIDAGYYFSNAGNYSITLDACASYSQQIVVNSKPATHFTYTISGDTVNFELDQDTSIQTLSWNFGDGSSPDTTDTNPVHTYISPGQYWVVVSVTNDHGCDSTYAEQVDIITGLSESFSNIIRIFPNPAQEEIFVKGDLSSFRKIMLVTEEGRIESVIIPSGNGAQISVSDLAAGVYLLRLEETNGESLWYKIEVY